MITQLWQRSNYVGYKSITIASFFGTSIKDFIYRIYRGFERIAISSFGASNVFFGVLIYMVIVFLLIYLFYLVIKQNKFKKYLGIILCSTISIGIYYLITAFVHGSHTLMATILSEIVLMIATMIFYEKDKEIIKVSSIILIVFFSLSYINLVKDSYKDINDVYSYGKDTAQYINNNAENDCIVILEYNECNPLVYAIVSSERNDVLFFDINEKTEYKFHLWGLNYTDIDYDKVHDYCKENFENKVVYYLSTTRINDYNFKLIYSNLEKESISGERYCIYKLIY